MKFRGIVAGALAFALSVSLAFAQVNQGTSPLTPAKGGTNSAFVGFTGPASSVKTFTLPNASDTIATLAAIQTFSAAKTFNNATLLLAGSSSGTTTLNASSAASGTLTLPAATDTLVGKATTDTLTNKTLTSPVIATIVNGGNSLTLPSTTDTLVGRATTDTLTNKTLTSPALVTPTLGAATATSINKMAITAPATSSTLAVADGKTATISNTLTLTGTDGSSVALGTGGTVAYQSRSISTGCGLAGGGDLSADRTLRLNLTINAQTGTTYSVVDGDCGKLVSLSNASAVAVTLPQANGSTFVSGWSVAFQNKGAGTVTITPTTSTINGGLSLALTQNQGVHCRSDGTNYTCVLGVGAGGGAGTVTSVVCGGTTITASGTCPVNDNLIINGDFRINQRSYVSAAALAASAYGHDRWKAGSGGGNYSFTQLAASTTITIAASKTLIQVVEDKKVVGGSYMLSWSGTCQARTGVNSATPSGAYAASPIAITTQTAGTTMSVEFGNGASSCTLTAAHLEAGTAQTPFFMRDYAQELFLARRYYRQNGAAYAAFYTANTAHVPFDFSGDPMRASPSGLYTLIGTGALIIPGVATCNIAGLISFNGSGDGGYLVATHSSASTGNGYLLANTIAFEAEL